MKRKNNGNISRHMKFAYKQAMKSQLMHPITLGILEGIGWQTP
jgi:hypothetical protein